MVNKSDKSKGGSKSSKKTVPPQVDERLWEEFCDSLKAAGAVVLRPQGPADAFSRAEGFRYLTRLLRIALEMHLEFADPDFPELFKPSHETAKIGGDNPDNIYQQANLSGRHRYRLSGSRGTVHSIQLATKVNRYAQDGTMRGTGELLADQLSLDTKGNFTVTLSTKPPRSGDWLPMEADTNMLLVRQTFLDRRSEIPADMRIERLGSRSKPRPLTPAGFAGALKRVTSFVSGTANTFADWAEHFAAQGWMNQLPSQSQQMYQAAGGDPNIHYLWGLWELGPKQALTLEVPLPQCQYWNFQLCNYWMESLDYRHHDCWINDHRASRREDGSLRLVVAHENPGTTNWIDTSAHSAGTMLWRWIGAAEHPAPRCRVVNFDELEEKK